MSHNLFYKILHNGVQCVTRRLEIDGKWTHYPLICSRCDPDYYYEEYQRMVRLAREAEKKSFEEADIFYSLMTTDEEKQ